MAVHHTHGGGTTIVESDREGPATALIVLVALIIVGALIWFFAFSGVVFDRNSGGSNNPDVNIQNPPAQQDAPDVTNNNNNAPAPTAT